MKMTREIKIGCFGLVISFHQLWIAQLKVPVGSVLWSISTGLTVGVFDMNIEISNQNIAGRQFHIASEQNRTRRIFR